MAVSEDVVGTLERIARASDTPALSLDANLTVTVGDAKLAVSTVDDRIRVQVPSVGVGVKLLRQERGRLPDLGELLAEAGLTAELRVGSAVVAVVGADATPGFLARRLGLGPVEVDGTAAVAAALRLR